MLVDQFGRPLDALPAADAGKGSSLAEIADRLDSGLSSAGSYVNQETAVRVGAVLACARVIADGCATPPLTLFRDESDGRKVRATDEPMYRLLHRKPNPWMSAFTFRRVMTLHAVLTGDAVALRTMRNRRTMELIPVPPETVTIERRQNFETRYHISDPYGANFGTFEPKDVFHLKGLSWDGFEGMDAINLARDALGLSMRIEEGQSRLHRDGLKLSGFLSTDQTMSMEALEKVRAAIRDYAARQSGGVGVLDMGFKYNPLSMTMVDAQTLEQRRFQIEEICRFMGVFPQMIGQADKTSTYASAEAFFAAHVRYTLAPWHANWTQEVDLQLLDNSGPLFAEFDTSQLEKANLNDRATASRSFVEGGIKTRNEVRREEGLDPLEGLDEPLTPLNMTRGTDNVETP